MKGKKSSETLPIAEIYFYYGSWLFGIIYSAYHVYQVGNRLVYAIESDLIRGWTFLNRKKDNADEEWKIWVNFIFYVISPWILVHFIGAQIINYYKVTILPLWYTIITILCIIYNYSMNSCIILFVQPVIFSLLMVFSKSRILIWLVSYILYHIFTHDKMSWLYSVSDEDLKLVIPTLMWIYLRCISFCMHIINQRISLFSVYNFFGYVFYLPCFFLGPILLYNEFYQQLYSRRKKYTIISILYLIGHNLRYFLWLFVTEFILHFIYFNSLLSYIDILSQIQYDSVWIMYGIGFFMGQFFFLKYIVVYGLALTWTRAEGYKTPNPPKCIACICLYSDMWRYFDQPLYFFIKKYIYNPCLEYMSPKSQFTKIAVSFLCFIFIYVWHGLHYSIFMWSLLNYSGIIVEITAKQISKTKYYCNFKKTIGFRNEQRLIGFICAPLTIISAISNFYFLGGTEVAETYLNYIFMRGSLYNTLCLWFFVYSLCQVSLQIRNSKKNVGSKI